MAWRAVVVGWPRRLDGTPTHQTAAVEAFARALESAPACQSCCRTSGSVQSRSRRAARRRGERDWRDRKSKLDAAAAAIILQDYLDARAPRTCESVKRLLLLAVLRWRGRRRGGLAWTAASTNRIAVSTAAEQFVDIPPGTGAPRPIGARLAEAGVVRDARPSASRSGCRARARELKAGEYRFDRAIDARST